MASFDFSLTEAGRMAQGACDATGTMGHDYSALGGFIGMGPDGAQHPFSRPSATARPLITSDLISISAGSYTSR